MPPDHHDDPHEDRHDRSPDDRHPRHHGPPHERGPDSPGPPGAPEEPPRDGGAVADADADEDADTDGTAPDGYLFVVDYDDDAERKRAEYLFDTWDGGEIGRPEGLARIVRGVEADDLHRELLVKFRAEQVDAYALSALDAPETPETRTIERTIGAEPAAVRSFLEYLVSKKKGSKAGEGEYEVYTNKGRADVSWTVEADADGSAGVAADDGSKVAVTVRGHPPALDYLASFFATELDEFERRE